MIHAEYRLWTALALSLGLHALPFLPSAEIIRPPPPPPQPLLAELRPPPSLPPPPPLHLPEPPKEAADAPAKPPPPISLPPAPHRAGSPPRAAPRHTWETAVRQHLRQLNDKGLLYPEAAIAQGLEGTALVLLVLDESGRVVAARLEQGSGHPLLDEAALRAVRSLESLPADSPRQAVIPVNFRLKR